MENKTEQIDSALKLNRLNRLKKWSARRKADKVQLQALGEELEISSSDMLTEVLVCRVGDLVFAKCDGYPPWPGKVIKVMMLGIYKVSFIGHPSTANIIWENLEEFNQITSAKYKEQYKNQRNINEKKVMKAIHIADRKLKAKRDKSDKAVIQDKIVIQEKKQMKQKKEKAEETKEKEQKSSISKAKTNSKHRKQSNIENKAQKKEIIQEKSIKLNQNVLRNRNQSKSPRRPIRRNRKRFRLTFGKKNKSLTPKNFKRSIQIPISEVELNKEATRLSKLNEQDLILSVQVALGKLQSDLISIDPNSFTPSSHKLTLHAFLLSSEFLTANLIISSRILQKMILFMKAFEIFASLSGEDCYYCRREYLLVKWKFNSIKQWWLSQATNQHIQKRRIEIIQDKLQLYKAYPI